jgi:hypothetical protein
VILTANLSITEVLFSQPKKHKLPRNQKGIGELILLLMMYNLLMQGCELVAGHAGHQLYLVYFLLRAE